ncbi:MAG: prolipoprotein diacylglyceryl transferase [Elusimicrobia bacterium]|nr:prolipoprotein diacylglyceryl transferase [Elusimicrobiota bacterium]
MHPFLFEIGGFKLASYGVMVALGYAAGIFYVQRRAREFSFDADTLWNLCAAIIAGALIGGKLLYVFLSWNSAGGPVWARLLYFLRDIRYGFVFFGGVFGSLAAAFWYARRKGFAVLPAADIFAPALALGHMFGRIGCFLAGCCHGHAASHLGMRFCNPDSLVDRALLCVPIHPVQLYEAACNLLIFLILHRFSSKKSFGRQGAVLWLYCLLYAAVRFLLEFLRGDDRGPSPLGLSPSQWIALIAAVSALITWRMLPEAAKDGKNG